MAGLSEELVRFIRTYLHSVWALELLLILIKQPERSWTADELVRDMRATSSLVSGLLERFQRDGLVATPDRRTWHWQPAAPELKDLSMQIAETYARTPFAVIQAIAEAPNPSVMDFADAFRLRDRDKR